MRQVGPIMFHCRICGTAQGSLLLQAQDLEYDVPGKWDYMRCQGCGGLQVHPMPEEDEIATFYPPHYGAYAEASGFLGRLRARHLRREARAIAALLPRPEAGRDIHILDVGCGDGSAMSALAETGSWHLQGVEIDPHAAERARQRGFPVFTGTIDAAPLQQGRFDLIRLGHVIEHVAEPRRLLSRLHTLLRPGGVLLTETPNASAWDLTVLGRYWGALHAPRHLVLFTPQGLADCLSASGFQVIAVRSCLPPVGWTLGVQNLLRHRLGLPRPPGGRYGWYPLLLLPFLPVSALQVLAGKAGIMAAEARKPSG